MVLLIDDDDNDDDDDDDDELRFLLETLITSFQYVKQFCEFEFLEWVLQFLFSLWI